MQSQKALETGKPCLQSARQTVAYLETADTSAIQQKLLKLSHILVLFQRSVEIHLAGPDAALLGEIADFPQTSDHTVSHDLAPTPKHCSMHLSTLQ